MTDLSRQDSVKSYNSDELDEEEEFYGDAPYDIYADHEFVGNVLVAKKGSKLPLSARDNNNRPCEFKTRKKNQKFEGGLSYRRIFNPPPPIEKCAKLKYHTIVTLYTL